MYQLDAFNNRSKYDMTILSNMFIYHVILGVFVFLISGNRCWGPTSILMAININVRLLFIHLAQVSTPYFATLKYLIGQHFRVGIKSQRIVIEKKALSIKKTISVQFLKHSILFCFTFDGENSKLTFSKILSALILPAWSYVELEYI